MQVLFRAKEKNSNNYVIGYEYYNHVEDEYYITHYVSGSNYKVDRTTRSINIEDMIDSQGNKIFASLSEDGKGGDCTFMENGYNETFCWDSLNGCIVLKSPNYEARLFKDKRTTHFKRYKIIGIQE